MDTTPYLSGIRIHSNDFEMQEVKDDDMFSEYVTDNPVDLDNTPVNDRLENLERDVTELLTLLRPLGPMLEQLPELMEKVGPFLDGAKKSPVLRMMGITIP